jgi:hypothetical protein
VKLTGSARAATLDSFFPTAVLPDHSWDRDDYGTGSPGTDSYNTDCFTLREIPVQSFLLI